MRLLDRPAAPGGGPLLVEALVLAAAGEDLGAGVDAGLEVEDHGVVGVADQDGVALLGAELEQPGLDAEPVEPVGEEADGLVVAEVGLAHPALGLGAAHPPAARSVAADGELVAAVGARRAEHDPRSPRPPALAARAAATISAIAKVSSRSPSPEAAETGKTRSPRLAQLVDDHVGDVAAVGDVDLVERDQARPVLEPAVPAQLVLDDVEVVDRVAARLDAWRCRRRAPARRSARCGAGSRGRGRGPRWRPRSGRARRRR